MAKKSLQSRFGTRWTGTFLVLLAFASSAGAATISVPRPDCPEYLKPKPQGAFSIRYRGYLPEAEKLSPTDPHTIDDVPKYLSDSLGEESIRAVRDGTGFLIVEGDGPEALKNLQAIGWKIDHEIEKPVGFHRVFRVEKDGEVRYAITRVNGDDRIVHIQTFLRLAGVAPEKIETLRNYRSWYEEYRSAFEREGYAPDLVVYGLTPHVEGTFIDTNRLIERPYHYLKRSPPGLDESDIEMRPFKVLTLEDGRKVWLLYPVYGDLVRDLVQAAYDSGVRDLLFLGTAGGVDPALKVGEWVSPNLASVRHSAVSKVLPYTRVSTPNLETRAWLTEQNRLHTGMIEVEAGYVAEIAKRHPDFKVSVDLILSDVLQGPHKLDLHQIPRVSQIPNLHHGIQSILGDALGKFRLEKVEDVFFPATPDLRMLKMSEEGATNPFLAVAERIGLRRIGTGVYRRQPVFSGQFSHLYFSAALDQPAGRIVFKSKLVGNPLYYHVSPESYSRAVKVEVSGRNPAGMERLFERAYEGGAGEASFRETERGYEATISFALREDAERFDRLLGSGAEIPSDRLARMQSLTHSMKSPDLEERVRAARGLILSKADYRKTFVLNEAKLAKKIPAGDPLFLVAEKIMKRMNDPSAFADFVEMILRKAAARSAGIPTAEEYKGAIASVLKEAGGFPIEAAPRRLLSGPEFNAVLARGKPFLDETFSSRTHGAWTHAVQLAYLSPLLEKEFGPGGIGVFLKEMGRLPDPELWAFLFDSLNDIPNHYSNPEILNQVLWRLFEIN